jgi:excisionase family DNA binding protein
MRIEEAARYLRLARSTFYELVVPQIPQARVTPGRVLFRRKDLDEFVESQMQRTTQ